MMCYTRPKLHHTSAMTEMRSHKSFPPGKGLHGLEEPREAQRTVHSTSSDLNGPAPE
jgi:hypothetical protein